MVRARVRAIECGYENAVGLDRLRHDLLTKVAVGAATKRRAAGLAIDDQPSGENAPRNTEAARLLRHPCRSGRRDHKAAQARDFRPGMFRSGDQPTLKEEDSRAVQALTRAGGGDDLQQSRSPMRAHTLVNAAGVISSVNTLKLDS
jgi:hypothetical protein